MQDIEQQRLEDRRIGPHRFEVEDLQSLERQSVCWVVEHAGIAAALDPFVEACPECSGHQTREREQSALRPFQDEQVLDGLIYLSIFVVAEPIPIFALDQNPCERMEEVNLVRG